MEAPTEWLQLEGKIPRLSSRSQQAMKNDSKKDKMQKDICLLSCKYDFSWPNLKKKFQMSLLEETEGTPEPERHKTAIKPTLGS